MGKSRCRIYADEDVPLEFIEHLRDKHNLNVRSAVEINLNGKEDKFQFEKAKSLKSFLLTKDKGFLDNIKYPFFKMVGIIIIVTEDNYYICNEIEKLALHHKEIYGKKIKLSRSEMIVFSKDIKNKEIKETLSQNECPCLLRGT